MAALSARVKIKLADSTYLSLIPDHDHTVEIALFVNNHLYGEVLRQVSLEKLISVLQKVSDFNFTDFEEEEQPLPKYIVECGENTVGTEELSEAVEILTDWMLNQPEKTITLHNSHTKKVIGVFSPSLSEWFTSNPFSASEIIKI